MLNFIGSAMMFIIWIIVGVVAFELLIFCIGGVLVLIEQLYLWATGQKK